MAARVEAPLPELLELPRLTVADFDFLLEEEIEVWEKRFDWDFRPSAELLRRFLQIRSLFGYALRVGPAIVGYAYYVCESRKGLIGDFFLRNDYGDPPNEMMLLGATVQGLMLVPGVQRIESQLLMLNAPANQVLPFNRYLTRHNRFFMEVKRESIDRLTPRQPTVPVTFLPWTERFMEETAHLVAAAYRGHIDSEINDQYRTIPGARHFLTNIIQFPGCGRFSDKASLVAVDAGSGRICGACLTSLVSPKAGHVTQLCLLPGVRGAQLGYELLRRVLNNLTETGCLSVSLTVTCANVEAVKLYEAMGFRIHTAFPALVWEGF